MKVSSARATGTEDASPRARGVPRSPFTAFESRPEPVEPRGVAPPGEYEATAETCTVVYERDGSPSYRILFALLEDGRRVLGRTRAPEVMDAMTSDEFLGGRVRLRADRSFD